MMDWQKKKLGELCNIELGKTPYRKDKSFWDTEKQTENVWLSIADLLNANGAVVSDSKEYISDKAADISKIVKKGTLLVSFKLTLGRLAFAGRDLFTNEAIAALTIKNEEEIDKYFLYKYLSFFDWEKSAEGDVKVKGKTLNKAKLKEIEVLFPKSLPEQQRIVSILDRAFAAIDKAKANAEQNLQNAKELFESYLQGVFDPSTRSGQGKGDGWEEKTLGKIGSPKMCKRIFKKETTSDGDIPFYKIGTFGKEPDAFISKKLYSEYRKKYSFPEIGAVLISASGTIGRRVRYNGEPAYFQDSNIVWIDNDETQVLNDYLYEFYGACKWGASKGATISRLYNDNLKRIKISFPKSKEEQQIIVRQLDALRAEIQKLEAVYQKKMDDLEELKKSILQKAFAGGLTSSVTISVPDTKVIPLQEVEGISPTDLQAGITAFALQKHIEQNRQHSFHHVKAEKIVHLSEYILNIDLDRNPVKDAAGPNDFPHAKKVESRARKAGFYSVSKNGDYYDYQQGNSFNKIIQKTQNCLNEKAETLSQIIDLLTPMSTQQAEVVATVYAAWNNLLLAQKEFSDEDIVTEARENWHEEKMAIERDKFFSTIEWMRKHDLLIPRGNGKEVKQKARKKK